MNKSVISQSTAYHLMKIIQYNYWEEWKHYRTFMDFGSELDNSLDWSNVEECMSHIEWDKADEVLTEHIFYHLWKFCQSPFWKDDIPQLIEQYDKELEKFIDA